MKLKQILKNKKGFTLMELIIVIVIIALLAAALLPSFLNFVRLAGERSLLAEARLGQNAAQVIMTENGRSPASILAAANALRDGAGIGPLSATYVNGNDIRDQFVDLVRQDVSDGGVFYILNINAIGRVTDIAYALDGRWVHISETETTSGTGPFTP